MTERYEKIRKALAMGPTPGPWRVLEVIWVPGSDMGYCSVATTDDTIICGLRDRPSGDAHLIAACDPDTIRELLEERDQLAAALEAARAEVERLNRLLGRIVEGGGDSTLTIRAGTDAFAAAVDEAKETDLWRCTVCGQVGTVGRCCGEETREPFRPLR